MNTKLEITETINLTLPGVDLVLDITFDFCTDRDGDSVKIISATDYYTGKVVILQDLNLIKELIRKDFVVMQQLFDAGRSSKVDIYASIISQLGSTCWPEGLLDLLVTNKQIIDIEKQIINLN